MEGGTKPTRILLSPPPLKVNYDQLPVGPRTRASWSGKADRWVIVIAITTCKIYVFFSKF